MISLKNVNLRYPLVGHVSHSLQAAIYQKVGGLIGNRSSSGSGSYVEALKDISFQVEDGGRLGIVGHNGAGKTTLLRVISGAYPPTSGEVIARGKISALTDFSLGMDPNANGIKNIVFRLVFMGHSFSGAMAAIDEIVEFSELGDFINLPVYTYSTGMFLRLAFAISTHFPPDILILDEVIGAGDESFRKKANDRLEMLLSQSRIVILSSHDMAAIKRFCDRAMLMHQGRVVAFGEPDEIIEQYKTAAAVT